MGIVTLLTNRIEGVLDIIDYMVFIPLDYGFPLFLIMILLGIAGIVIDSVRRPRYFLITISYSALIAAVFVYGIIDTIFLGFFNLRDFIQ
jgi:hypothetical protein